ncbi:MAG: tRNA epoxyqueuosine(34) reductase QueG [Fidelibacterota bacterium]|nr:MAG: tRNA epoxyqueuosine(34) reductase QueG [Candidatus Neomarinimicrobiota bacterium]
MKKFLRAAADRLGFQKVGFAAPGLLEREADHLKTWLAEGRQGTMDWMARRQDERTDPTRYYPTVRTVVSLAMNYYVPLTGLAGKAPRWSNYAWGDDYHRLLKQRMKALLGEVVEAFPGTDGLACVDTSPVMEKVWAQRAGLGWQGKHTNLITRDYGSWVFLGELLLDAALEPDPPFEEDLCGSCTACLEACPTGALTEAYRIDARRCISYLTIEHRGAFSREQAGWLSGWIYGCDVCQEVCPWNLKFAQPTTEFAFAPREFITAYGMKGWEELSPERWDDLLRGSAARRAGYEGLKRNIQAVSGGRRHPSRNAG